MTDTASSQSPTFRLADHIVAGGIREYVDSRRRDGRSWRRIAIDLMKDTDGVIDVTHETLRSWFPDGDSGEGSAA